jgi:hypothetical protein
MSEGEEIDLLPAAAVLLPCTSCAGY